MTTRINFSEIVNFTEKQDEANEALKKFKFVLYGGAMGGESGTGGVGGEAAGLRSLTARRSRAWTRSSMALSTAAGSMTWRPLRIYQATMSPRAKEAKVDRINEPMTTPKR